MINRNEIEQYQKLTTFQKDVVDALKNLGFDVKENASMYFVPNWITKYGIDEIQDYLLTIGELGDDYEGDCIPTMTIGDIINILPTKIDEYVFNMNKKYVEYNSKTTNLFFAYRYRFINSLFDTLVWCIKQKHIAL